MPAGVLTMDKTYTIVRFHQFDPEEVVEEGVTLEHAQEHCKRDDTSGDGWFDGFREEV